MLILFLLLFGLSGTPIGLSNNITLDQKLIEYVINRNKLVEKLSINIEDKTAGAYRNWDSIPISSPIKLDDIITLSSDYGIRIHPILKVRIMHRGIDLAGKAGVDILTTANGIVTTIKKRSWGYGNYIIVTHKDGYKTRYAHLSKINVKQGQQVQRGEKIGELGSTGMSTGPHLHYEVIKDNETIDPLFFSYAVKQERSFNNYKTILIALKENFKLKHSLKEM